MSVSGPMSVEEMAAAKEGLSSAEAALYAAHLDSARAEMEAFDQLRLEAGQIQLWLDQLVTRWRLKYYESLLDAALARVEAARAQVEAAHQLLAAAHVRILGQPNSCF